jgi:hypothetical protein
MPASLNRMAFTAESALVTARRERNEILYAPQTGMIDTALAVKAYVKGVFGAASPEFKAVNHIHFQGRKIYAPQDLQEIPGNSPISPDNSVNSSENSQNVP